MPYLEACIKEALRRHSTSSMGLPRVCRSQPQGSSDDSQILSKDTEFKGEIFKAGTILSVPSYSIHHLDSCVNCTLPEPRTDVVSVWGDPFVYRPERWLEGDKASLCGDAFPS